MKLSIYQCAECGEETDPNEDPSTYCPTCKKDFCESMSRCCFAAHHRKSGCKGTAITITNPKWIMNLVKSMDK